MEKIRSIQVVNVRWLNATAWYGLFLSRLLKEKGHETLVLGLANTKSFSQAEAWGLEPIPLNLNTANPLQLASLYGRLRKIVRDFRPDVVNCHRGEAFILWGMLKSASQPFALIRTRGDQRPPKNNLPNRMLYGHAADALIATNSRIVQAFTHKLGVAQTKVHLVPGGVDENIFFPDPEAGQHIRESLGIMAEEFVIGLLGRFDPVKGHAVLFKALGNLRKKYQDNFKFRILCPGKESSLKTTDLKKLLYQEGLEDRCILTGHVDNIRAWINAMNLGVLASTGSEAIARAALEIMACGVPLLSSDVGVMPDLLPAELLVPAADVSALEKALEIYCFNTEALAALRAAATKSINKLRSGDFLEQTLAIYRECAKKT